MSAQTHARQKLLEVRIRPIARPPEPTPERQNIRPGQCNRTAIHTAASAAPPSMRRFAPLM